ncbi:MAG TPA: 2-oxoglutarate and iron-dependent oxygenase domain-containing protein [Candidatus Binataceae bacterium]|nr:2-oxoglutarate and iron-dependent oxygenase domain-containing protein [Candidatus Binataceae bacterium]
MALMTVPVIDVAAFLSGDAESKRKLAAEVNRACEDIGFWIMTGHGIERELCNELFRVNQEFFDLPVAEKLKCRIDTSRQRVVSFSSRRGYLPVASEAFSYSRLVHSPGDLRESFSLGPIDVPTDSYFHTETAQPHFAPNLWPERPAELKTLCLEYYRRMSRLSEVVARIFALALGLEENYFEDRMDKHTSALLIHHYPDQPDEPLPDQLRTGAHSDLGMFTILRTEDEHRPGGLEVRNRAGAWVEVPAIRNSFVMNIGDMMMRWTNDRWISTMHRVLNPPRARAVGNHRMSAPFFYYPNYDTVVECLPNCSSAGNPPKYPPVACGDYRMERISRVMNFARSRGAAVDETRPSAASSTER